MYQMKDMDIADQYNKSNSKSKLHASLCVWKRMQDREHPSASKRETVWKAPYCKKLNKCKGRGILSMII